MINAYYGIKGRPTRVYNEAGKSVSVTEIAVTPIRVVQIKTQEIDGYSALQVGFDWKLKKKAKTKMLEGHLKKAGQDNKSQPRFLREIREVDLKNAAGEDIKVNDEIMVSDVFKVGDAIKVTGTSKAKGFQGGVRRHGFKGGPKTHGQSDRWRAPGSIGQTTTPGRVYKGKRMAGHMGREQVTVKGLTVIAIDVEKNTLKVKGMIPGNANAPVYIQKQAKSEKRQA